MDNKERLAQMADQWIGEVILSVATHKKPATPAEFADRIAAANLLAPEWVNVKERLPEKGVEVLVEVNGHRGPAWRNNHNLVAYLTEGGAWIEERHGWNPLDVISWQEILPDAPKDNHNER
jgi:hypothetical protein